MTGRSASKQACNSRSKQLQSAGLAAVEKPLVHEQWSVSLLAIPTIITRSGRYWSKVFDQTAQFAR